MFNCLVVLTLCSHMDCSPPGSSVQEIFQARILEWVVFFVLQWIFLTQGSNLHLLCLLHWQVGSLPLEPLGSPESLTKIGRKRRWSLTQPFCRQLQDWTKQIPPDAFLPLTQKLFSDYLGKRAGCFWPMPQPFAGEWRRSTWISILYTKDTRLSEHPVPITSWQIDEETETDFIFLGSKNAANSDCSHEIKRQLLGRKTMTHLDSLLKSKDITLPTKAHKVKAMVFPLIM